MLHRQSGLSLIAVAIGMAALAAAAMFGLYAIRHEGKLPSMPAAMQATIAAQVPATAPASSEPLRKCTINGKTVISNSDCKDSGQVIRIHDSKGIESPKAPPPAEAAPEDLRAKMVEKATR
ncbi:MAG TPA: DUF4124 domain-containing protein [Pseudoduganella sp.]